MTNHRQQLQFIDYFVRHHNRNDGDEYQQRFSYIDSLRSRQQVYFSSKFLPVYNSGHHLDHLKIGYKPIAKASYTKDQLQLAPTRNKATHRQFTRHRIIYGPLAYYLDGFDEDPVVINTITACAINLMGTSSKDLDKFIPNGEFDSNKYRQACQQSAALIIKACKANNIDRLVIPAFGVGVYVRLLPYPDRTLAKKIMNQTFAKFAKKYDIIVDWIVWNQSPQAQSEKKMLDAQTPDNKHIFHIIADMIDYTNILVQQGVKCAMLNPGSDRTIGGMFTKPNPKTLEEQIAQKSDLLALHTVYNDQLIAKFERDLQCGNVLD